MTFHPTSRTNSIYQLLLVVGFVHVMASGGCSEMKEAGVPAVAPHFDPIADFMSLNTELHPWKFIILHHTATESGSVESIDSDHKQRIDSTGHPWRGIGYHFLIGNGNGMKDGQIAATFRWKDQLEGAHAGSLQYNTHGIGICLVGNFENQKPTEEQVKSTAKLVKLLSTEFALSTKQVLKHGDLKSTACPGRQFPFEQITASVSQGTGIAHQQNTNVQRGLFQPVRPGSKEEIQNVAAISRSKSNALSTSDPSSSE